MASSHWLQSTNLAHVKEEINIFFHSRYILIGKFDSFQGAVPKFPIFRDLLPGLDGKGAAHSGEICGIEDFPTFLTVDLWVVSVVVSFQSCLNLILHLIFQFFHVDLLQSCKNLGNLGWINIRTWGTGFFLSRPDQVLKVTHFEYWRGLIRKGNGCKCRHVL